MRDNDAVSFFERNRRQLAASGVDPERLPPGQYHTERFPVLHVGDVPHYDMSTWTLRVFGAVEREVVLSFDELRSLPATAVTTDIHCVTKWSKFDTVWKGVRLRDLYDLAGRSPEAQHVIMHAEFGYTANVPLADTLGDACLLTYEYDGGPLEPEHGFPARTLIPHLYLWKSVKWIRGIELSIDDRPGFWERNGYHNYGDPWEELRYTDDRPTGKPRPRSL
jgi:DMSO/TMAO reductase YedYZ molybdopterin-dependent catalytic subunit